MRYIWDMIDTLTISRELQKAGFSEQQADALASIESRKQEDLATKTDINDLKADMNDMEGRHGSFKSRPEG